MAGGVKVVAGRECLVAVGTGNPLKTRSVGEVFRLLCTPRVVGVRVEPGVGPQPRGFCSTFRGALGRALAALEEAGADYGVGVEAGVTLLPGVMVDFQAAAIVFPGRDGVVRAALGMSMGFMVPPGWAERLAMGEELAEVAGPELGYSPDRLRTSIGVVGVLSGGAVTRRDLTVESLLAALIPLLNPRLYPELPDAQRLLERLGRGCSDPLEEG